MIVHTLPVKICITSNNNSLFLPSLLFNTFLANLATYPVTLINFSKEPNQPISMTSPTPTFWVPLLLTLHSPLLSTTFFSSSLSPGNKKTCSGHISCQQYLWTISWQGTFFQPFNGILPGTNICWIQGSWNMKPVFTVNILPNFLEHVLFLTTPYIHLPYPLQYNLWVHPTEHSNNVNPTFHSSFHWCFNLLKKHTNKSNLKIEISLTGASLHLLAHNITVTLCSQTAQTKTCTITFPQAITKLVYLYPAFFTMQNMSWSI